MAGYKDSEARAEDNLSSAWTLVIVGGIGLVVLVLGFLGIIPIPIYGGGKYLFYGVMAALCIIFIFAGIVFENNLKWKAYMLHTNIKKKK